jgi:hypothetical protein
MSPPQATVLGIEDHNRNSGSFAEIAGIEPAAGRRATGAAALGMTARVEVTGANPALRACLAAQLPAGVTLVDRKGRRWSG